MNYEQKSNLLLNLLNQLADDSEYLKKDKDKEIQTLTRIYSEGFRHSYAKISTKVQSILENDINKGEYLSQNLQMIKKSMENLTNNKEIRIEICSKVRNLCDHVNLEIGHYNLIVNKIEAQMGVLQDRKNTEFVRDGNFNDLGKRIADIENKMTGVVNKAYDATKELEKVDDKLERNSMSSITTLTIFSAVILAFTGSITFTSGVFSGMSKVSPYRIVFVTSIIGLIVFDLIFMLLFIVGKMVGKNVCCQCSYYTDLLDDENINVCGIGGCKRKQHMPNFGCILLHKYPYIVFVNSILGIIMYYDLALFFINNPNYIPFVKFTDVKRYLLLCLPLIVVFLFSILHQIKKCILYHRTINAISLVVAQEYFDDEDNNVITSFISRFAERISELFSSKVDRKTEIEKILDNMPELTNKKRERYLIKQLKDISKIKVIRGGKNLIKVSYREDKYNKVILKKTVGDILNSYENFINEETESDGNIIDVEETK